MEEQSGSQLGMVVLWEGLNATLDIVAIHGLGANPAWAWTRKIASKPDGKEIYVNWLKDEHLLPSKIPNARIMTFNYESRWHKDAPRQRRSLCATQLLTALDNQRKEEKISKHRPLIFLAHSFGGNVVEQALVSANIPDGPFQHLATSTVGIVFLGTPHRGTKSTKWGEMIALSGKALGYETEGRILKDLREDSEPLVDLLYTFTLWLFRASIPVVCFFEQHVTDYGTRLGLRWRELVVEEKSACIDGHQKIPLPTDHLKINKFTGDNDPSYRSIYPIIMEMAQDADEKVKCRLQPRDKKDLPQEYCHCLQSLLLTDPQNDLASLRRSKGDVVEGTCEWLLVHAAYSAWLTGNGPPVFWLVGDPGIGKTMISSFLVDELERKAQATPNITFAYYFCDNKDEKRRTATAIIRGLLLQLFRQRAELISHLQIVFDQMRDQVFTDFDALWRILLCILKDAQAGEIYFLIDALDECEVRSRNSFIFCLEKLSRELEGSGAHKIKFLITCRPISEIEEVLSFDNGTLRIDSAKVNADLSKFIDAKVGELADAKPSWPLELLHDISKTLQKRVGGTFLWAALVLHDISTVKMASKVRNKLKELPVSLRDVYDGILSSIGKDYIQDAILLLRWVVIAQRPLTVSELSIVGFLSDKERNHQNYPTRAIQAEYTDYFRCCEPLLYRDAKTDTINLVHQSAKDYLLSLDLLLQPKISAFHVVADATNLIIFQTCWEYLKMGDFDVIVDRLRPKAEYIDVIVDRLRPKAEYTFITQWYEDWQETFDCYSFFQYAAEHWDIHAIAAETALHEYNWDTHSLSIRPTLRDSWLLSAARHGQTHVLERLLDHGCEAGFVNDYGNMPLLYAATKGHEAVIDVLLDRGAGINTQAGRYGIVGGRYDNALQAAALGGHEAVVQLLLRRGADINLRGGQYGNAIQAAALGGHKAVLKLLFTKGAEINTHEVGEYGNALQAAAVRGHLAVVQLLLEIGLHVNTQGGKYGSAVQAAASGGHKAVLHCLLARGAEINMQGGMYGNALQAAACKAQEGVVNVLIDRGAKIKIRGGPYGNALQAAAFGGNEAILQLLLSRGAGVNVQGGEYGNALQAAAFAGNKKVLSILIEKGAEINAQGGKWGNALQAAAYRGHKTIVGFLLEKGAKINAQGGTHGNALQAAASRGHTTIVEILLERGADINARGGEYANALQATAFQGHTTIVEILIEKGAEINTQGGPYGNALQAAASHGNTAIIQLLLEKGAKVNLQGGAYDNSLTAAAYHGHKTTVEILLEKGADVDIHGGAYGNALQAAVISGNKALVEVLLDNGAKVDVQGGIYNNALEAAIEEGHDAVVQLLLSRGALPMH